MLEDLQTNRPDDCPDKRHRVISAVEKMSEAIQDIQQKFATHLDNDKLEKSAINDRIDTLEVAVHATSSDITDIKAAVEQNSIDLKPVIELLKRGVTWLHKAERWSLILVLAAALIGILTLALGIEMATAFVKGAFGLVGIKLTI